MIKMIRKLLVARLAETAGELAIHRIALYGVNGQVATLKAALLKATQRADHNETTIGVLRDELRRRQEELARNDEETHDELESVAADRDEAIAELAAVRSACGLPEDADEEDPISLVDSIRIRERMTAELRAALTTSQASERQLLDNLRTYALTGGDLEQQLRGILRAAEGEPAVSAAARRMGELKEVTRERDSITVERDDARRMAHALRAAG